MELYRIQLLNKSPSYFSTRKLVPGPSSGCAKRGRRANRLINVHVDNLRDRPLSDDDMEVITECIPELYTRIDQTRDLTSLTLGAKELLRPPKDFGRYFTAVPRHTYTYSGFSKAWGWPAPSPPPVKQPAVVSAEDTVLCQVFSGSLVTPPHPTTLTSPFRWRHARNQYDLVEVSGQQLPRVISCVETTWEKGGRVLHRQFRVSVYRTDGQMMLSVFCSFPIPGDEVRRRIVFSEDGAPSASTRRKREADVDETIVRSPPRSKPRLRL